MMKSFEECIDYIENKLDCKLWDWQNKVLRNEYDGKHYCYNFGRTSGKEMLLKADIILKALMNEENDDGRRETD